MITLRLDKKGGINRGDINMIETDNKSDVYIIQLYKGEEVYNLTGKTVELSILEKKRGYGDTFDLPIYEATTGKIKLEVLEGMTKTDGLFYFQITVKDSTGLVDNFPIFPVEIKNSLKDDIIGTVVNSPYMQILLDAVAKAEGAVDIVNDIKTDYDTAKTNLQADYTQTKTALQKDYDTTKTSLQTDYVAIKNNIQSDYNATKTNIQNDYNSLRKVIMDENASAELQGQINDINSDLDNKANESEVVKRGQVDLDEMTERTLQAIQGGGGTSFELLSIPRDNSVTPNKIFGGSNVCWKDVFKFAELKENKIYSSGNLVAKTGVYSTNLARIKPNVKLTVNSVISDSNARFAIFSQDGTHIQQYSFNNIASTPNNAYWIGCSIPEAYKDTFKVTCDDGVENVEIEWLKSAIKEQEIENKHIKDGTLEPFKFKDVKVKYKNLITNQSLQQDKIYSGGNLVTKADYWSTSLISVSPRDKIHFINGANIRTAMFREDETFIKDSTNTNSDYYLSVDSDTYFLGISIPTTVKDSVTITNESIDNDIFSVPWLAQGSGSNGNGIIKLKGMIFGDSLFGNNGRVYNYPNAPYNISENGTLCKGYVQIMEEELGVTLVNRAVGGWGTPQAWNATSHPYCIQNLTTDDLADIDFVILSFATNDAKSGEQYGELGKTTDTTFPTKTFLGAYRNCINHILTLKPSVKIILWTSIPRDYLPGESGHFGIDTPNANGLTLADFNQGVRDLGQLYSFPVVDMFLNSNLNTFNIPLYTFEGVHLTNSGYKFVKNYMLNSMRLYLS